MTLNFDDNEKQKNRIDYLRELGLNALNSYDGTFAGLERLDRDLKSVIRSLDTSGMSAWSQWLIGPWGQLEIIYASALDENRSTLAVDEILEIRSVVSELIEEFTNPKNQAVN